MTEKFRIPYPTVQAYKQFLRKEEVTGSNPVSSFRFNMLL